MGTRKLCLMCEKSPAKKLFSGSEAYFCTTRCAALYGLSQVEEEYDYCEKHQIWFLAADECPEDHDDEDDEDDEDWVT